jgi:outer membrane protein OmpA-like peptidoglycan-associated protein
MRTKVVVVIAAFVGTLLPAGVYVSQAQAQNEGMGVLARPVPLGSGGGISGPAGPSKADIINALTPGGIKRTGIGLTRGPSVERGKEREALELGDFPRLNLPIEFEPNSERLTAASQKVLATLGAALKEPELERSRIAIAAHTDGRGSEQQNQRLSERRAAAVKDYLVRNAGIKEARLVAIGFGKSKPLNPADPLGAENRRIEIVNLRD